MTNLSEQYLGEDLVSIELRALDVQSKGDISWGNVYSYEIQEDLDIVFKDSKWMILVDLL
jgi:hypothetical protein